MRTDDLIRVLAADHGGRSVPVARYFPTLSAFGMSGGACLFLVLLEPRGDLLPALASPRVVVKLLFTLALAGAAGAVALAQSRPEANSDLIPALVPAMTLLALGVAGELIVTPAASWGARLVGSNAFACVSLILLLSMPLLAAGLAAQRLGAPADPARAGAGAGLFAGGLGAALYALHCVDDSPLFVAAWYGLGIAAVAGVGAALGARVLRW